jgi:hypothetical protein
MVSLGTPQRTRENFQGTWEDMAEPATNLAVQVINPASPATSLAVETVRLGAAATTPVAPAISQE